MSIRNKMLLGGILMVSLPLIIVGFYSYFSVARTLHDDAKAAASGTAEHLADIIQLAVEDEIRVMTDVALGSTTIRAINEVDKDGVDAKAGEIAELDAKLARFIKELGQNYESISVMDSKGMVFSDGVGGKSKGIDVKDRAYFKTAINGQDASGDVVISRLTGNPITIVAVPIKVDGKPKGIVAGILTLDYLGDRVKKVKMGKTGYAFMARSDSLVIAHKDSKLVMNTYISKTPGMEEVAKRVINGDSGVADYTYNGVDKIAGFAHIPLTNWTVIVTQDKDEFMTPVRNIRNSVAGVGAVALVLACFLIFYMARSITKPLARAVEVADAVAAGDLHISLNINTKDELGSLASSLDSMTESLRKKADLAGSIAKGDLRADVILASEKDSLGAALKTMVGTLNSFLGQVRDAAIQVAAGSGEVADSSQSLSQGASEQAASLEEIGSSMTEVGSQTKTNAENASQANQLALGARDAAETGNQKMGEMISAMNEINDSSREIAKIIKAIDDIAFQTNLLALNAAVEAARAGKHGKGFAVVAQEVRNLAGRSAKAARETAELIEGSVKKVEKGVEIVNLTAVSLEEIVETVTKAADLIGEIAAASNEQAQGISQINVGLGQIEQVTQQNTSSAEETASAAEELSAQAQNLRQLLTMFKLKIERKAQEVKELPKPAALPGNQERRKPATTTWGAGPAEPVPNSGGKKVRPEEIISLDEGDFGKY